MSSETISEEHVVRKMEKTIKRRLKHLQSSTTSGISNASPELIPTGYAQGCSLLRTSWAYNHMRWMVQKDALNQDMFLIGTHSPLRRWLAFRFCEVTNRECEYVALTSDTSEADLKARRELRLETDTPNSTISVVWFDQAVVRAATLGRVLILEGLEKAERNVLPVLNNLLENREMQLEDGRFLVAPKRYDELVNKEGRSGLEDLALVRVHEKFRVIAVGVPSPPFPGNPLDPPLRSRFQARYIERCPTEELLLSLRTRYAPTVPRNTVEQLLATYEAIWALGSSQADTAGVEAKALAFSALCYPCEQSIISASYLLECFPGLGVADVFERIFPAMPESGLLQGEAAVLVGQVLSTLRAKKRHRLEASYKILKIIRRDDIISPNMYIFHFLNNSGGSKTNIVTANVGHFSPTPPSKALQSPTAHLITRMIQSAVCGNDVCLIGGRGEGKTFVSKEYANCLGYVQVETLFLFEDMTARDLLQRRSTNSRGESVWEPTPLSTAMECGRLCILDGLHRLPAGTIAALVRLIQDREVSLYDGTRFISTRRWEYLKSISSEEELLKRKVRPVHPSFRILGLAAPPEARARRWLSNEVMQLFHFFVLPLEQNMYSIVVNTVPKCPDEIITKLVEIRNRLIEAALDPGSPLWVDTGDSSGKLIVEDNLQDFDGVDLDIPAEEKAAKIAAVSSQAVSLSMRQIIRAARRAAAANFEESTNDERAEDIGNSLEAALMTEFMPRAERASVREILRSVGLGGGSRKLRIAAASSMELVEADFNSTNPKVTIGDVTCSVYSPKEPALVPYTLFFPIPQQKLVLRDMLRDLIAGEHILLMGNQGVGKNKMADKLLMLLQREREYIQLHRDTTVGSLTLAPSLREGIVVFDDSPLVKAMIHGRILLIDEFDKAPTEVVVVLKALLEDGEILLADGRRFVHSNSKMLGTGDNIKPIAERFQVIALANRPGYPFLGNDFFREMGDCFACHAVQNPDQQSEIVLLKSYAPEVPETLLRMLTSAFRELRESVDAGKLIYPYSTRELTNVVRHLAKYPGDTISNVLENVFAFDVYDMQLREVLFNIFQRHGIPLGQADASMNKSTQGIRGTAVPTPLPAPSEYGNLIRQPNSKINVVNITCNTHKCKNIKVTKYRDISPADAEDSGGVPKDMLEGEAGGEWKKLLLTSARSERFCEEDQWWRIGMITREGVMIKGVDPLQGSWMGDLLAMESCENTLCVLTSRMEMHVHDLKQQLVRELPLMRSRFMDERSIYANGKYMVSIESLGCLVLFDQRMGSLLKVFPKSGVVESYLCPPPGVRLDSWEPGQTIQTSMVGSIGELAIMHDLGGTSIVVFNAFTNVITRLTINLPKDFVIKSIRILGPNNLLLYCYSNTYDDVNTFYELNMTNIAMPIITSVDVVIEGDDKSADFFSSPLSMAQFPVPAILGDSGGPTVHVSSSTSTYATYGIGIENSEKKRSKFMGYARPMDLQHSVAELVGDEINENNNDEILEEELHNGANGLRKKVKIIKQKPRCKVLSCIHKASRSKVSVTSIVSDNHLAVDHNAVLIELVDMGSGQLRQIAATKFPGLGLDGIHREGQGTGGSLADRGLKVTVNNPRPVPKELGMASAVACCETSDGRLALLFSDAHVRILEVRLDKLAVQEALFTTLTGNTVELDGGNGMRGAGLNDIDVFDDEFDDDDDWSEEDDDSDEVEEDTKGSEARGRRGSNQRGKRGQGRGRGGKGKGKGSGKHLGGNRRRKLSRESKESAADVLRAARKLASEASNTQRLELNMDQVDEGKYDELFATVENEVNQLRVVLQSVEAKEKERSWLRGKTTGELDDSRLVDLAIGEKNVYKRRGQREESRLMQRLPKRMSFCVDVSGSMAYFNGDQRLDRLCATVVMLMEALAGLEHKYQYEVIGHSGETFELPLVNFGHPPTNRGERLAVVQTMVEHAASCRSGDNTLAGGARAVKHVRAEEADDYFVFLISDANLEGYGVSAEVLAQALTSDPEVNAYAVFIAEPRVAAEMQLRMPSGRAHVVLENEGMPLLFKDIFTRAMLSS